jgi:hypothetical protein
MSDHGFDKTDVMTSEEDLEKVARELSMKDGVVAVHIVQKVGAGGGRSLITLCDEALELSRVIAKICAKHKVGTHEHTHETWRSLISFRNGKKAINAFI